MALSTLRGKETALENAHDFRRRRGASTEDPFTALTYCINHKAPQCATMWYQLGVRDDKRDIFNTLNGDGVVYDMRDGDLPVKTSGHGDPRAGMVKFVKGAGAMCIFRKISFAMAVCCVPQAANAHQLTSHRTAVDSAAWLSSDLAKGAFVTALIAGGFGAIFIWKRFFCRPPTFTVAGINAALEAGPSRLHRDDLLSIYPRIDGDQP